jgi:hypothetical protein
MALRLVIGELVKLWDRPDGVLTSPVPVLEDIDDEDDPDSRLLSQYGGLLDAD